MLKYTILLVLFLVPSMASAQWYGAVDFMVPTRSNTDQNVFQRNEVVTEVVPPVTDPPTPSTFITTVGTDTLLSLDLDFVTGGRATIGYQTEVWGLEGSFLSTDQWNVMASVSDAAGGLLASPFTLPGEVVNPLVDNNTFASVAYRTKLKSTELNLTHLSTFPKGEGIWKFGVRALWLDEAFQYDSTNSVMDNILVSKTANRIIGPQIGFRGQTWAPGGSIALSLSGMLGYNNIDRTSVFNGVTTYKDTGEASFVGDASIEYLLNPHPNVFVRIGYQALGVGSVALAPNDPMINNKGTESVVYSLPYFGVVLVR